MSVTAHESKDSSRKSVWPMFIAGLGMIALFWGATELIRSWIPTGSNEEEVRAAERIKNIQELRETDRKELEGYSWVDKDKGLVRIPIERAMDLEVAVLNQKKPTKAYPVQTPPVPAGAAPAESAPAEIAPAPAPAVETPAAAAPAPETQSPAATSAPATY
jgi:hypothetical protein